MASSSSAEVSDSLQFWTNVAHGVPNGCQRAPIVSSFVDTRKDTLIQSYTRCDMKKLFRPTNFAVSIIQPSPLTTSFPPIGPSLLAVCQPCLGFHNKSWRYWPKQVAYNTTVSTVLSRVLESSQVYAVICENAAPKNPLVKAKLLKMFSHLTTIAKLLSFSNLISLLF